MKIFCKGLTNPDVPGKISLTHSRTHALRGLGIAWILLCLLALLGCPTEPEETEEEKSKNPASTAPAKPEAPTLTVAEQRLTVTWAPVNGAASYGVQWSPAANGKTSEDGITGTSYVITGLTNGTEYTVKVRAKNAVGTSEYGPSAKATPAEATKAPDAPVAPTATASDDTITVTWTFVTEATKYQVWYGTDTDSSKATQFGTDHSASPVSFSAPANGTYYVWIKAGNSKGYSGFSPASASVTVSGVAKIVVIFAGTEAASTGQSKMMQKAADKLNASGRFHADVQVNGALSANTDDLVTRAKLGEPLVVPSDPGRLAGQFDIPDLNILAAPYVLTDIAALNKLPDTALFKEWSAKMEAQGVSFVANMFNGFRNFYTTTPVKTVADLSDLRIRGFGNNMGNALAKYFGFANIDIAWGETLPGIQQGTLDGCEVQVPAAYGAAIYEVAKYLALTKHYMLQTSFVCATNLLTSMPASDQQFFLGTIRETAAKYSQTVATEEAGYYQQMRDKGVTVTEVDLKPFQDAIAPLYTNNDLNFSAGLKDRLFSELGL